MKKLAVLISLLAFVFVASTSTSYAQTTDDKKAKTEQESVSTSKKAVDDKAPCPKATQKKCKSHKPGHKCSHSKKAPCPKTSAKKNCAGTKSEAVREEEDKTTKIIRLSGKRDVNIS